MWLSVPFGRAPCSPLQADHEAWPRDRASTSADLGDVGSLAPRGSGWFDQGHVKLPSTDGRPRFVRWVPVCPAG